jgi:hypothetical protein
MKLTWDSREYEAGVDRGVFFGPDGAEAWSGLVSISENTPELRSRVVYIEGVKATVPIAIFESKASAHLVIDASLASPAAMANLEAYIYGSDALTASLPTPDQVVAIFEADPLIKVIDNGDGTFTVDGPDELVHMLDATEFEVISPVAVYLDGESYTIRSF